MKIVKKESAEINEIIRVLDRGGLVVFPTETLYGIGVDATNKAAIEKLSLYKKRPIGKPYSVAVSDVSMAQKYAFLNKNAKHIYKTFLPGPVTVISKGKHKVAPGVESETGTLGIRIPDYKFIREIIRKFGKPITATSANASYKKRPYKISDILENISGRQKELIDLIIDAGALPKNEPSTVIDTTYESPTVLRQGNIRLNNKNEILSRSDQETQNFAKEMWQKYEKYRGKRAVVFALIGEMGAGKTIFTKGLAKAMGITDLITSPTFNLINTYQARGLPNKLIHLDVWRIADPKEISELNLSKDITDRSVLAIEWAEKIAEIVRGFNEEAAVIWVKIEHPSSGKDNERLISWGNY